MSEGGRILGVLEIPKELAQFLIFVSIIVSIIGFGSIRKLHEPSFLKYHECALDIVQELRNKKTIDDIQNQKMKNVIGSELTMCDYKENKKECIEGLHRTAFKLAEIASGKSIAYDLERAGIEKITDADSKLLVKFIKEANNSIKMIGISGHVLLEQESEVKPILREKTARQVEIKMLALDPKCDYVKEIAKFDAESETSIKSEIETGLAKFSMIPGVKIRTYCQLMTWGALFIDNQKAIIMHCVPSKKKTCFLYLRDSEVSIFKSYKNTFEKIWNEGKAIKKTNSNQDFSN